MENIQSQAAMRLQTYFHPEKQSTGLIYQSLIRPNEGWRNDISFNTTLNASLYSSDVRKLLQTRDFLTSDIKNQLSIYAIDKKENNIKLIGSMSYRSGNASDVDTYETIMKPTEKEVINFFKTNLLRVAEDIYKLPKQYFLEVKLGLDHLFKDIDYGYSKNNVYFVSDDYFNKMEQYLKRGFININEYDIIKKIERKNNQDRTQLDFETIQYLMRKKSVLRWNMEELRKGFKELIDIYGKKYKYTVDNAIIEKSQINIEGIYINSEGYYTDCSNFFDIRYINNYGIEEGVNLPYGMIYDTENYRKENLLQSTYTLMYSELNPNIMKSCKRLFSYGKLSKNLWLLEKVYPIINSQLGKTYQLMSKLKTCLKIAELKNGEKIDLNALYHTIEKIRFDLDELIFIHYDFGELTRILDMILVRNFDEQVINMLDVVLKGLMEFINQQTKIKMELIGLYPLPKQFIPNEKPF